MSGELEELVGFISHANPTIRLAAAEHLAGYSATDRALFKAGDLGPVEKLKVLTQDEPVQFGIFPDGDADRTSL